jgi:hypothetical protein
VGAAGRTNRSSAGEARRHALVGEVVTAQEEAAKQQAGRQAGRGTHGFVCVLLWRGHSTARHA